MVIDLNHGSGFQVTPDYRRKNYGLGPPLLNFSEADANRANDAWGANCGPGAIAAVMGMTLDGIRPHLGDFESKGYTNPLLMGHALRSIGRPWRRISQKPLSWPEYGLARVQWEGPWTAPGVPERVRYRHTHWIAACADYTHGTAIFDINCIRVGWVSLEVWREKVVPWLLSECEPKADGNWHLTHAIEVAPHD